MICFYSIQKALIMSNSGLKYFVNEFAKEDLMARGAYNLFAAWGMSENDHTKLLVAILKYNDTKGKYSI